jgi:hypothetical protein
MTADIAIDTKLANGLVTTSPRIKKIGMNPMMVIAN